MFHTHTHTQTHTHTHTHTHTSEYSIFRNRLHITVKMLVFTKIFQVTQQENFQIEGSALERISCFVWDIFA